MLWRLTNTQASESEDRTCDKGRRSARPNLDGDVTRVNPPPGVAATLKSLLIYTRGAGMIETSNTGTSPRGAPLGQWERIGNDLFAIEHVVVPLRSCNGASVGTQEIDQTMRLSAHGESFTAVAVIDIFDVEGNRIGGRGAPDRMAERSRALATVPRTAGLASLRRAVSPTLRSPRISSGQLKWVKVQPKVSPNQTTQS
jgi:hypothetical protein